MNWIARNDLPRLHQTPLAEIRSVNNMLVVECDNEDEVRMKLVFKPYQAARMITADCYHVPRGLQRGESGRIYECQNSSWIAGLREALAQIDVTATFLDNAHHFYLPLQDEVLEIVALGVEVER